MILEFLENGSLEDYLKVHGYHFS